MRFNLKNKDYILVEVPSDASDFVLRTSGLTMDRSGYYHLSWKPDRKIQHAFSQKESINIVGKLSEVLQNEELCSEIVEQHNSFFWKVSRFYNYLKYPKVNINKLTKSFPYENLFEFFKATDSFKSFLQSINLDMGKEYLLISKQ